MGAPSLDPGTMTKAKSRSSTDWAWDPGIPRKIFLKRKGNLNYGFISTIFSFSRVKDKKFQDINSPKNVKTNEEKTPLRNGMYSFHPNSYKTKTQIIKKITATGVNLNSDFKKIP